MEAFIPAFGPLAALFGVLVFGYLGLVFLTAPPTRKR